MRRAARPWPNVSLQSSGERSRLASPALVSFSRSRRPIADQVLQDCQVDRPAKLRGSLPRANWTPNPSEISTGRCFQAEFQFVVDQSGLPEVATIQTLVVYKQSAAVRSVVTSSPARGGATRPPAGC